jgi:hypothetical protein
MPAIIAYAALAGVSFLLHFVWEKLHIGLYTGYEALEGALPVFLYATLGDVGYTLLAVLVVAALRSETDWMRNARRREYALLAGVGLAIALFVETKAHLLGRWEYTDAMPTLWGFGLSPLVQMTVLLPLSVYISVVVMRHFRRYNTSS